MLEHARIVCVFCLVFCGLLYTDDSSPFLSNKEYRNLVNNYLKKKIDIDSPCPFFTEDIYPGDVIKDLNLNGTGADCLVIKASQYCGGSLGILREKTGQLIYFELFTSGNNFYCQEHRILKLFNDKTEQLQINLAGSLSHHGDDEFLILIYAETGKEVRKIFSFSYNNVYPEVKINQAATGNVIEEKVDIRFHDINQDKIQEIILRRKRFLFPVDTVKPVMIAKEYVFYFYDKKSNQYLPGTLSEAVDSPVFFGDDLQPQQDTGG